MSKKQLVRVETLRGVLLGYLPVRHPLPKGSHLSVPYKSNGRLRKLKLRLATVPLIRTEPGFLNPTGTILVKPDEVKQEQVEKLPGFRVEPKWRDDE